MFLNKTIIGLVLLLSSSVLFVSGGSANTWHQITQSIKELKTLKKVSLDDRFIQRYNSRLGLWHYVQSVRMLKTLVKKYKTTQKMLKKVNGFKGRYPIPGWVFVPFSDPFYKSYTERGITRKSLLVPQSNFIWPIKGSRITSRVGNRWGTSHSGLDIAAGSGSIVLAAQSGRVLKTVNSGGYGRVVFLEHKEGYITKYAHLSSILVKKQDIVEKGQIIALSGNTGRSTGPHLHFELECGGILLDPENFLPEFNGGMESFYDYRASLLKKPEVSN